MKKLTALFAALLSLVAALSATASRARAFEYVLEGTGASRSGYETCNQSLAAFENTLSKAFVKVLEKPKCIPDSENKGTFVPKFKVLADKPYSTNKIIGSAYNSLTYCQIELQRLIARNPASTPTLEGNCVDQKTDSLFKPELIVLIPQEF